MYEITEQVSERLALSGRPLIVDEMDHIVNQGAVEVIRDIYEGSHSPDLLYDREENLPRKLSSGGVPRPDPRFHCRRPPTWKRESPLRSSTARISSSPTTSWRRLPRRGRIHQEDILELNLALIEETELSVGKKVIDLGAWTSFKKRIHGTGQPPRGGSHEDRQARAPQGRARDDEDALLEIDPHAQGNLRSPISPRIVTSRTTPSRGTWPTRQGGILEAGPRHKGPGRKAFPGAAGRRRTYRLLKDSLDAPRILPDGTVTDVHPGTQRMWNTIRARKVFNLSDLHALSSTTRHPVARSAAAQYLKYLEYAGYVRKVEGKEISRATYRIVKNTGPKAPVIQRVRQVWDPNVRKVVWPVPEEAPHEE
jgi:hypothetical protein